MNRDVGRFWEGRALEDFTAEEWEALCDGCGRCCLLRLEDADTGEVYTTDVACRLLDRGSCRCGDYPNRRARVPDCMVVTPEVARAAWLPPTCAYGRLARGEGLADWHPLVSGDPGSVVRAGVSVAGRVVSEDQVEDVLHHLVEWPEPE